MRKPLLIILTISFFISCSSVKTTKQAINTGNYDKAIAVALKKLKSNKTKKSNQQYVLMLEEAFAKVTKRDHDRIEFLQKDGNPENLESIYNLYIGLNNRQERIKPILPLHIIESGTDARFDLKNYNTAIINAKENLSEHFYVNALTQVESNDKNTLRNVYYDLEYIEEINPNYKDVRSLMNKVHANGIDFVFVSMKNESDQIVPARLEEDLLNFNTYGLDDFWTVYHSTNNSKIRYDFGLELNLRNIQVSPEKINERQIFKEKLVKDGFTYVVDSDGNKVKDSLGNNIKVDRMISVKCELYQITQIKSSFVAGQVKYVDYSSNQVVQTFPIESEFIFEHAYATYRGDTRALEGGYVDLIALRAVIFPSNEQMVYDTGTDLKEKLKQIITRNGFR